MRRLFLLLPLLSALLNAQAIDPASKSGYESINAANLKANLTVLASDSLEGRETSYTGQRRAAQYIANIFKKIDLKPLSSIAPGNSLGPLHAPSASCDLHAWPAIPPKTVSNYQRRADLPQNVRVPDTIGLRCAAPRRSAG